MTPDELDRLELTDDDRHKLLYDAEGFAHLMGKYKITLVQLQEVALNYNIEKCPTCRWFVESSERIPDGSYDPDDYCCNCRPHLD